MVRIQEADFTAERPLRLQDTTAQLKKSNHTMKLFFEILQYQKYSKMTDTRYSEDQILC